MINWICPGSPTLLIPYLEGQTTVQMLSEAKETLPLCGFVFYPSLLGQKFWDILENREIDYKMEKPVSVILHPAKEAVKVTWLWHPKRQTIGMDLIKTSSWKRSNILK